MKSERRRFLHLAATAAAFPALSRIAWSQSYPVRPVRVVLGLSPGGSVDIVTRIVAQALSNF
jgi:tripartite-type tricarboxylate transporter receptor subunit TctC